jgi:TPR repeat protein
MQTAKRRANFKKIIAALRVQVAQGELEAMTELGMWLQDGHRDKRGRVILRRNRPFAFRLFKAAAERRYAGAFSSLGYSYDSGVGTSKNKRKAVHWYTRAYRDGQSIGASNLATVHRDRGDFRPMLRWWMRAAAMGDGDSMGDAGYCYQYGIGARKNVALARKLFRRAIDSRDITAWGREEAQYHLGVSYIDAGKAGRALPLLSSAASDRDYPEALEVTKQIRAQLEVVPCRCRRHINKNLRGHADCPVHTRKRTR